jgi:hypothetical protein
MGNDESNRKNAQKSTGPHDTTSTRLNATKHGLSARGMTELDDSDAYESLVQRLTAAKHPVGDIEEFLIRRIAFHMIRLQRAERLEAEYITGEIHPAVMSPGLDIENILGPTVIEPGRPAAVGALSAINLVSGFQRYETAIENKLYRAIAQLERLQRARQGEFVPAPQIVDVSVHSQPEREA